LPLNAFDRHPKMKDGHINKCKQCFSERSKELRKLRRETLDGIEIERAKARERYHKAVIKPKQSLEYKLNAQQKYIEKYPEKIIAKSRSKRMGVKIKGNQLHHWSYNIQHAKDVIEMSVMEHRKLHRYMIYDQERMMYRDLNGVLLDTKEAHLAYYETLKDKP
jgi:hypothetical protein